MPIRRHASRIVEPSVTRTLWPSTVSSTTRLGEEMETTVTRALRGVDRRVDGVGRRLAEVADGRVAHHLRQVGEHLDLVAVRLPGCEPVQRLLLSDRADATRDALAA